jgi:hypothetical protein
MIHPDTELRFVSPAMGYGVFATACIPRGTIVYVKDPLEIELTPATFARLPEKVQAAALKYGYIDERGTRIVSWDLAKYVNHSCNCNTISTGYGFEIAIRDIASGDEITDEYGLLNPETEVPIACGCPRCRHVLKPDDIDTYHRLWDRWVQGALEKALDIAQPLWELIEIETREELISYLAGRQPYRSVRALKCQSRMIQG